ncbi:uncharacterized protein LOC114657012 [Erpetoichthys calabaricus]|uniref:uncharacterized protein LOC114657012 n=1 Tax=Erpetoichthys calabaricus TaxID=27687 RepID=UPI00109F6818|nr:uncharacterized protein LOC114657012 [Erpetoichthys calabaricus]
MAGVSGTAGSCEPPKKAEEQEESEQRALLWEAAKIRTDSEVNVAPDGDEVCQQVPPLERACEEHSVEIVDPEEETPGEQECPICTELYDTDEHPRALLNCGHVMCNQCLNTLLKGNGEADIGRVSCPICRQKTPMLEWEIRKMQEDMAVQLSSPRSSAQHSLLPPSAYLIATSHGSRSPPARGFGAALERRFQLRFQTTRMCGCLPCVRYPVCLIVLLGRLQARCRCCYLVTLALLYVLEMSCILLIFLPVIVLVVLFTAIEK